MRFAVVDFYDRKMYIWLIVMDLSATLCKSIFFQKKNQHQRQGYDGHGRADREVYSEIDMCHDYVCG